MKTIRLFIATIAISTAMTANATNPISTKASFALSECGDITTVQGNDFDEIPTFPGGMEAMYTFIAKHIQYPQADKQKGISAVVVARFNVQKDGSLDDIEIVRHGTAAMDKEVARVIKLMPKWNPGTKNGVPTVVSVNVPFNFKFKKARTRHRR